MTRVSWLAKKMSKVLLQDFTDLEVHLEVRATGIEQDGALFRTIRVPGGYLIA